MSFTDGLKKLGQTVTKFAPLLGGVIGGPGGTAIGALIANSFGGDIQNPDELINIINASPEAALKLKELEINSHIQLQQLAIKQAEIEANDRDSARKREVSVVESGKKNYVQEIMAIGILLIYGIAYLYSMYTPVTQDDVSAARIQDLMIIILTYYFGTSMSSRKKDEMISNSLIRK